MSSSDSIGTPTDLDPVIAEAVDGVTNRFGAEGLEQMIAYAERKGWLSEDGTRVRAHLETERA